MNFYVNFLTPTTVVLQQIQVPISEMSILIIVLTDAHKIVCKIKLSEAAYYIL